MKPFRFSLEKVLKVRQLETTKAKQALAMAQLTSGQAWVASEKARASRVAFEADWERRRAGRSSVSAWQEAAARHEELVAAEKEAVERLHAALAEVAAKRAELEEAQRREKALEKLREQQYAAHEYTEQTSEQALIDEMAQTMGRIEKGVG